MEKESNVHSIIKSRQDLSFFLKEDFKQMGGGIDLEWLFRWIVGEENARMRLYLWVLRHLEYYSNVRIPIIGRALCLIFEIWHRRQEYKYGVHIVKNVCGYGLRIIHIGGIHINANRVGNYFSITCGCVLGKKNDLENRPYVGNNVEFTLGAKAIGCVHIGDNSVICQNSVVIKDVPANCIASGVPINILKERK